MIGVTLQMWDEKRAISPAEHPAVKDAKSVCERLAIPHYAFDGEAVFKHRVVDYFCRSYVAGKTPNPCIVCNRYVKWGLMWEKAKELGADHIATGHYARIQKSDNGRFTVVRSRSKEKDQTYVLFALTQEQLSHTLMPLGEYEKDEVREIARQIGLEVADKSDSQDICFIPDGDYHAFLARQIGTDRLPPPGNFVKRDGTVVGRHQGITHYTIGQRKGLGIALNERMFVNRIDAERNEVVIGSDEECYSSGLVAERVNHMGVEEFDEQEIYLGRIRYADQGAPCKVSYLKEDDNNKERKIEVRFLEPVRAVTKGQAIVLYKGDMIAGGGVIC